MLEGAIEGRRVEDVGHADEAWRHAGLAAQDAKLVVFLVLDIRK